MNENTYLKDDERRTGVSLISGFALGALVGAGLALLLAPAPGTDTRRKVGATVKKLGTAARHRIQQGRVELRNRFLSDRHGFEDGRGGPQGEAGRREPAFSTGAPGQTGRTGTTGRTNS